MRDLEFLLPLPKLRSLKLSTSSKMDISLKVSFLFFFFWLSPVNSEFQSGTLTGPDEKSRQLHIDQNNETREFLKSELDVFFSKLWESLSQNLTRSHLETLSKLESLNERIFQIERNQEEISANLSLSLNESIENLHHNLSDSFNEKLNQSDSKAKTSFLNLTETLSQKLSTSELKLEQSLGNVSSLLSEELRRSDLKILASIRNLTESLGKLNNSGDRGTSQEIIPTDEEQISTMSTPQTTISTVESETELVPTPQPSTHTEVEEVNANEGTIQFYRRANSPLRRKIWIFRTNRVASRRAMNFLLEQNGLGANARISIFSQTYAESVWRGNDRPMSGFWIGGYVIVMTLVISPSAAEQTSFKVSFGPMSPSKVCEVCSSEIIQSEGQHVISFPPNNTEETPKDSFFVAVVARQSGEAFQLTLKHLELPGTPPDSCNGYFYVWFLQENHYYKQLPTSVVRKCGSVGAISEPLGNSTLAIIHFSVSVSGKSGFSVEVK